MKLELLEYSVQLISYAPNCSSDAATMACAVLQANHPNGESYVFRAYPSNSGWSNPSILSQDVIIAINASRIKEAERLWRLLQGLFNLHGKDLIQNQDLNEA